jgi:hypothetical protein
MDARKQKAHELADRARIIFADGCYTVPSQSGSGKYTVILDERESLCDCPDFELRGEPGKLPRPRQCNVQPVRVADERGAAVAAR